MTDQFPWTTDDGFENPFAIMFRAQENQMLREFLRSGGTLTEWFAAKDAAAAGAISQPGALK